MTDTLTPRRILACLDRQIGDKDGGWLDYIWTRQPSRGFLSSSSFYWDLRMWLPKDQSAYLNAVRTRFEVRIRRHRTRTIMARLVSEATLRSSLFMTPTWDIPDDAPVRLYATHWRRAELERLWPEYERDLIYAMMERSDV